MLFCEITAYVHGRQCYYPGKFMHYHAVDRNIGFDIFMPWTCEYISDAMLISVILFKYLKVAVKKLHLLFLASSFFFASSSTRLLWEDCFISIKLACALNFCYSYDVNPLLWTSVITSAKLSIIFIATRFVKVPRFLCDEDKLFI